MTQLKFEYLKSVNNPSSIHGIYPYRGKISAIDAIQLISQLPYKGVLLDPFCGSGTILYEARKHGLTVIGVDSNPIAIQISKAKLSKVNAEDSIRNIKKNMSSFNLVSVERMPEIAARYFHSETADQIMHLKKYYQDFSDYEKATFLGTICLAARGCNNYKWSSTQIGSISPIKTNIDFFAKYIMKLKKHAFPVDCNGSTIIEGDTRELGSLVKLKGINFVYTSPPYFDALDYTSNYTRIVHNIFGTDVSALKKNLIQSFEEYANDMKKCFEEIKKITTNDALIIFVVGNKKRGKNIIDGGEFFSQIISEKPDYIIERKYSGTASKIWDKINKTERKEHIIVWDKSKW